VNPIVAVVRANRALNNCIVVGKVQGGKFAPQHNDPDKFTCPPGWKATA
jgi:hypothetical protein